MPSKSRKQAHLMAAVAHNAEFAQRVGIPQSVGREFNDADKRARHAGGGKVKSVRDLQAALDAYKENKLPQKGFFSTLDELIATSPGEKAPVREWFNYLQPGRKLVRDGIEFPLKKEELEYAKLTPEAFGEHGMNLVRTRDEMRKWARSARPDLGVSTYIDHDATAAASLNERGLRTPGRSYSHIGEAQYDEDGLRHAGIPGSYEESVTVSPDLGDFSSHFSPQDISWSRTTRHRVPTSIENMGLDPSKGYSESDYPTLRLIEEIQSDRHSAAADKVTAPVRDDPVNPHLITGYITTPTRRGYRTPKQGDSVRIANDKINKLVARGQELRKQYPVMRERPPKVANELNALNYQIDDERNLIRESESIPPDAPFKDPRDYATLETRKQLLNSVADNDRFLGITRGADQVQRYEQYMDERRTAGMEGMYDKLYPSVLKKEAGRYGARVRDVEVPDLARIKDTRPRTFVEHGAETFDDYDEKMKDAGTQPSVGYQQLIDELRTKIPADNQRIWGRVAKFDRDNKTYRELTQKSYEAGTTDEDLERMNELHDSMRIHAREIYDTWTEQQPKRGASTGKSFPAAEITPEVADRIRRVGVPIFKFGATALGADLVRRHDNHDEPQPGMAEGGTVAPKKALDYWKAVADSLTDGIPGGARINPHLKRVMAGAASNVLTRDPQTQEQSLGTHPGIIDNFMALPEFASMIGPTLEATFDPGVALQPQEMRDERWNTPQWSKDAAQRQSDNTDAATRGMGLAPAHGFVENAENALGDMATQVPVPGKIAERLKALRNPVARAADAGLEYFSPTIRPEIGNYLKGAGFGGALGAGVDALGDRARRAQDTQFMQEAIQEVLAEEGQGTEEDDDAALAEAGYAEGGKVAAIRGLRQALGTTDRTEMRSRVTWLRDRLRNNNATLDKLRAPHGNYGFEITTTDHKGNDISDLDVDRSGWEQHVDENIEHHKAEGGKVKAAQDALKQLRRSTDVTDIATRKAALDQAVKRMTVPGSQIPFERRQHLQTALTGAGDAAADLVPARRQQRFGDYESNIMSLLENTAPTLAQPSYDPAITTRLQDLVRQAPPPLPPTVPARATHGALPDLSYEELLRRGLIAPPQQQPNILKKASGGLTGYAPAVQAQKTPGAPIDYEHYGEGPEQLFMGDRRIALPEGWSPQQNAQPGVPKADNGSAASSYLPALGVGALAAYDWYTGRNDPANASIGGTGSTDDIAAWNDTQLQGMAPPDDSALPGWWDTIKGYGQGALGALGIAQGVDRGGAGGYGQALSGAGGVSDALGDYGGGYGDTLGGAGNVLSGVDQGGVKGYGQAAVGAGQVADSFGYDELGNYVPIIGGLLGAYNGTQSGTPAGYAQTAAGLYQAGTAAGVLSAPVGGAGTMAAGSGAAGAASAFGSVAGPVALGFVAAELGNAALGTGREGPTWSAFSDAYDQLGLTPVKGRIPSVKLPNGAVIRTGADNSIGEMIRDAYLGGGVDHAKQIIAAIPANLRTTKEIDSWFKDHRNEIDPNYRP